MSRGEVYVRGRKTTNTAPEKLVRHGLGYVPQVSNVFPDLTVRENLEMGAYTRHRGKNARISELLRKSTVRPWPSVRRPSSRSCSSTLNTSWCAFSISSRGSRYRAAAAPPP